MHDLVLAGGKALTLRRGALRELEFELEPASLENSLGDAGMQRQRLGIGECIDLKHGRIGGLRGCGEQTNDQGERRKCRAGKLPMTGHEAPPSRSRMLLL